MPTFAKNILHASLVCTDVCGLIDPDHGGSMLLCNIDNDLPVNIMSYQKRLLIFTSSLSHTKAVVGFIVHISLTTCEVEGECT